LSMVGCLGPEGLGAVAVDDDDGLVVG